VEPQICFHLREILSGLRTEIYGGLHVNSTPNFQVSFYILHTVVYNWGRRTYDTNTTLHASTAAHVNIVTCFICTWQQ
jgi:hypothetical protein